MLREEQLKEEQLKEKQLKDEQALKYTENVIRAREEQREALNRRLEKLNAKKNK